MTRWRPFELGKRMRIDLTRADVQCATRPYEPGRLTPNEGQYERRQNLKFKRGRSQPVRGTAGIPTENDDQSNDLKNEPTNHQKPRQVAPYQGAPTYRDPIFCLRTAAHYVISFSIRLDERTMLRLKLCSTLATE